MCAIKTADIVLFGGCNQLNVTHTHKYQIPQNSNADNGMLACMLTTKTTNEITEREKTQYLTAKPPMKRNRFG